MNTILNGIVLATLLGLGKGVLDTYRGVAEIREQMMPRSEVELKLQSIRADLRGLEAVLQQNNITLVRMQSQIDQAAGRKQP